MKFKIEKFNEKGNFTLWKERVKDILVDKELLKAPPMKLQDLQDMAVNTIRQCLAYKMMYNMMCEKIAFGLWSKLEKFYMTNNLYNKCNIPQKLS